MSNVSVSDAAKLTGKSFKTIYRYLDSGKLSYSLDDKNNKRIDISELNRFFNLSIKDIDIDTILSQNKITKNDSNNTKEKEITFLVDKISFLENMLKEKDKQMQFVIDTKNEHINDLRKSLLLLENKIKKEEEQNKLKNVKNNQEVEKKEVKEERSQKSWWKRIFK